MAQISSWWNILCEFRLDATRRDGFLKKELAIAQITAHLVHAFAGSAKDVT